MLKQIQKLCFLLVSICLLSLISTATQPSFAHELSEEASTEVVELEGAEDLHTRRETVELRECGFHRGFFSKSNSNDETQVFVSPEVVKTERSQHNGHGSYLRI